MKKVLGVMFVVLAILAMAVPVSAQQYIPTSPEGWWYKIQGNQVMMLEADNLALINQIQRQGYRSLGPNLRWGGNAYGIPVGQGFYPMYDSNKQPLSGRQRVERAAGIIAIPAAIGGAVGGWRGGIIGAAIGGGVALLNDSRYRGQPKNRRDNGVIVTPPSPGQGGYVGSDGIPVATGTRPNANRQGPVSNPPSTAGDWRVSNRTSKRAELWDGEQFIARIEPWQSVQVDAPENGYTAVLLIPNRSGGLNQETAQMRSSDNFNGWDIVVPAVQ